MKFDQTPGDSERQGSLTCCSPCGHKELEMTEPLNNSHDGKHVEVSQKIRDTKGTFHAKMGSIKNRNGMDLAEAGDIKKRWQEELHIEKLYKKELHKKKKKRASQPR